MVVLLHYQSGYLLVTRYSSQTGFDHFLHRCNQGQFHFVLAENKSDQLHNLHHYHNLLHKVQTALQSLGLHLQKFLGFSYHASNDISLVLPELKL